ncbi:MAG: methyltransferase domain-containing protein [Phycisphaerales bacterium]|nr:MAG: methyltransferase domain-containing protein [Phycisphaerales bacterium]
MSLSYPLQFFASYLRRPHSVGAIAPSSGALARALCEPFSVADRSARVLEIGAGTGAVTRRIGQLLGATDRLDIFEVEPAFADILEQRVLTSDCFVGAVAEGRVRLFRKPAQEIAHEDYYDYVISGLPFTSFHLTDVRAILDRIKLSLKPGGVFSYFEYVGLRRLLKTFSMGKGKRRVTEISTYMDAQIRSHQFARRVVMPNLPPALARHLRFCTEGGR